MFQECNGGVQVRAARLGVGLFHIMATTKDLNGVGRRKGVDRWIIHQVWCTQRQDLLVVVAAVPLCLVCSLPPIRSNVR
jgi:hypothetical protein